MELLRRWQDLAATLSLADADALGADLIQRYDEPQRYFHGVSHLAQVLDLLVELDADPRLQLAAWFHDAIYRPGRRDNERRSAALARTLLATLGLSSTDVDFVVRAVMATAGHDAADAAFDPLLDADLAILGASPDTYRSYADAIGREFAHIPALLFKPARARFLRSMLDRPAIFRTRQCRARFESQARHNLQSELDRPRIGA